MAQTFVNRPGDLMGMLGDSVRDGYFASAALKIHDGQTRSQLVDYGRLPDARIERIGPVTQAARTGTARVVSAFGKNASGAPAYDVLVVRGTTPGIARRTNHIAPR